MCPLNRVFVEKKYILFNKVKNKVKNNPKNSKYNDKKS